MISRPARLATTGLLAAGLALAAAAWPSRTDGPAPAGAGPADLGAALFQAKGCATCHTGPSTQSRMNVAPSLADLRRTAGTREAGLGADAYVRQSIRSPQAFVVAGYTAVLMPTLAVDDQELDALVAYLLG